MHPDMVNRRPDHEDPMRRTPLFLVTLASVIGLSQPALAQESEAFSFGNDTHAFMLLGVTTGGSFGSLGPGGYVGGEWSLAWMHQGLWGGLYADGWYDFGQQATTFTLGPEIGFWVLGLDGGLGVRLGREDTPELGFQGRVLLTLGNFALYGRYGGWPGADGMSHVGQVGVTLKLPVWTSYEDRPVSF